MTNTMRIIWSQSWSFAKYSNGMSGLCSPKTIGITNEKQILTLIRRMKILLKLSNILTKKLTILCSVLSFVSYGLQCSPKYCIIVGIPNSLLFTSVGYYVWTIIHYKVIYFHIICCYIKFRIQALNDSTVDAIKGKQFYRIQEIICRFSSIYVELYEYDSGVWSKFLAAYWLCLSTALAILGLMLFRLTIPLILAPIINLLGHIYGLAIHHARLERYTTQH